MKETHINTESLSDQFAIAVANKRQTIADHQIELRRLIKQEARSKSLPLYWSARVTVKNAEKTIQLTQIILSFEERLQKTKAYQKLDEVNMSTRMIWEFTQLPSIHNSNRATPQFRGYLKSLKEMGLLKYCERSKKWSLTEKGILQLPTNTRTKNQNKTRT